MADKPDIDDYDLDDSLDSELDAALEGDNTMNDAVKSKNSSLTRRQIDDLLEQKRLERELRDSYDDFDEDLDEGSDALDEIV